MVDAGARLHVLQRLTGRLHHHLLQVLTILGNGGLAAGHIRGRVGMGAGDHDALHRNVILVCDCFLDALAPMAARAGQIILKHQNGILAIRVGNAGGIQIGLIAVGHALGSVAVAAQGHGILGGNVQTGIANLQRPGLRCRGFIAALSLGSTAAGNHAQSQHKRKQNGNQFFHRASSFLFTRTVYHILLLRSSLNLDFFPLPFLYPPSIACDIKTQVQPVG